MNGDPRAVEVAAENYVGRRDLILEMVVTGPPLPSMGRVEHSPLTHTMRVGVPLAVGIPALVDQIDVHNSAGAWALCGLAVGLSVAGSLARDRAPVRCFAAVAAVGIATQLIAAAGDVHLTSLVVLPLGFAFYFLGRFASTQSSTSTAVAAIALMLGALALNQATAAPERSGGMDVVAVVLALPLGWALGLVVRSREVEIDQARRDREQQAELEQRRLYDTRTEERLAIARDMHDIVAHSLTTLTVHAEVLRSRSGELPTWANERIDALADSARHANLELHGLLGTLREHHDRANTNHHVEKPAPRLDDLRALADDALKAGQRVELNVGDAAGLSRLQEAALYRVAQEAVSNARRHAPGAATRVRLDREGDVIALDISNDPPAPDRVPDVGTGHGLLGIEERIHVLGGNVTHGTTPNGGYRVAARVPVLPTTVGVHE